MKKIIALLLMTVVLASCSSQKVFEDYELSYSRSGGYDPIYENFLIKGNTANYFYETQSNKYRKKVSLSKEEKQKLYDVIKNNDLKNIREDIKKVYDNITTTVKVRNATEQTFKNDGSFIVPAHQQRWNSVVAEFENLINSKGVRNK